MITTERNTDAGRLGDPERTSASATEYGSRHVLERRLRAHDRGTFVRSMVILGGSFEQRTDPKQGEREGGQP